MCRSRRIGIFGRALKVAGMLMKAAAALVAFILLSAPARADDVGRVALPGSIEWLVAGPEGGAWIGIQRANGWAVGRANADHRVRTTALEQVIGWGTLGPDGAAYFPSASSKLARVDAAGTVTLSGALATRANEFLGPALAAGSDGRLWTTTAFASRLARITPAGQATFTPLKLPGCHTPLFATA